MGAADLWQDLSERQGSVEGGTDDILEAKRILTHESADLKECYSVAVFFFGAFFLAAFFFAGFFLAAFFFGAFLARGSLP